jgi:hypothetical protein
LNNNQPIVVFTLAVAAILYGTLGLVLLCFGTIAITASSQFRVLHPEPV